MAYFDLQNDTGLQVEDEGSSDGPAGRESGSEIGEEVRVFGEVTATGMTDGTLIIPSYCV